MEERTHGADEESQHLRQRGLSHPMLQRIDITGTREISGGDVRLIVESHSVDDENNFYELV